MFFDYYTHFKPIVKNKEVPQETEEGKKVLSLPAAPWDQGGVFF